MPSFSTRRAVAVWDTSMCLECYWKYSKSNAASRPAVRRHSTTSNNTQNIRTSQKWVRHGSLTPPYRSARRLLRQYALTPAPARTFATSTISHQLDTLRTSDSLVNIIPIAKKKARQRGRNGQDGKLAGQSVRALLKQWQPAHAAQATPTESTRHSFDGLGTSNDLTRPESADVESGNDDPTAQEYTQSYINDFDRITEATVGENDLGGELKRGDLVELRGSGNSPLLAVYLGISHNRYFQFYSISGRLYSASYRMAHFQINGYFKPSELDAITPYIPAITEDTDMDITIPRTISAPILNKIVKFRIEFEEMYRKHSSSIDDVFDRVALPKEPRFMFLEDIVSVVTGQPVDRKKPFSPALLFAVSNALLRERYGFTAEMRSYASTRVLCVHSKESALVAERVQRWLRAYQEDAALAAGGFEVPNAVAKEALFLKAFVRKCSRIIAHSRSLRRYSPEGMVLCGRPDVSAEESRNISESVNSISFSASDKEFIKVLQMHTLGTSLFRHPTYRSLSSTIVRAVGVYPGDELREDMCWYFLVEIGVVEPYVHSQDFNTEVWPTKHEIDDGLHRLLLDAKKDNPQASVFALQDSMQHLRRDWGDLPVYCIDSENTDEIDDGISLERIPDEPDNFWLHVHIAHVSAFSTRDDLLGRSAENRLTSIYMPDQRLQMLPKPAGQELSLRPDRACLTYSTKLTRTGETLEYKIQAGIVRNVLYMTTGSVNGALREASSNEMTEKTAYLTIQCGQPPDQGLFQPSRTLTSPSDEHRSDLKDLIDLCRQVRDRTVASPMRSFFTKDSLECKVSNVYGRTYADAAYAPPNARFTLDEPHIELKVYHDVDVSNGISSYKVPVRDNADMMVEQAMLLANVAAGKWAKERNLPIIYTGTRPAVEGLEPITALARQEVLQGNWNESYTMRTLLSLYAVRVFTTFPVEQKMMGTPEYAKVTSPLRRFFDLVSSWQIDSALRYEHATGKSLVGRTDSDYENGGDDFLPYKREELQNNLRIWVSRSQVIQTFQNRGTSHWICHAIACVFYLNESTLPSPLTVEVGRVTATACFGKIRELEYNASFTVPETEDGTVIKEGDVWEVRIQRVSLYTQQVLVHPLHKIVDGHAGGISGEKRVKLRNGLTAH